MAERSADWMKQAKRDLEMAKKARESGFYEWACFIAQQAAEKGVKSVYQAKGGSAIGHGIGFLLRGLKVERVGVPEGTLKAKKEVRRPLHPLSVPGWDGRRNAGRSFR